MEEGGKEGKRGAPSEPEFLGSRVEGGVSRGWCEGGTPKQAGEKKKTQPPRYLLILGEKWKMAEKHWFPKLFYTPKSEVPGAKWKWPETLCNPKLFVYP